MDRVSASPCWTARDLIHLWQALALYQLHVSLCWSLHRVIDLPSACNSCGAGILPFRSEHCIRGGEEVTYSSIPRSRGNFQGLQWMNEVAGGAVKVSIITRLLGCHVSKKTCHFALNVQDWGMWKNNTEPIGYLTGTIILKYWCWCKWSGSQASRFYTPGDLHALHGL